LSRKNVTASALRSAPSFVSVLYLSVTVVPVCPRTIRLISKGTTEINHVFHIDRGYENLVARVQGIGADITRIDEED